MHPYGDGDELCDSFVAPEDVGDDFSKVFAGSGLVEDRLGGGGGCGAGGCEFAGGFIFIDLWVVGVFGDEGVVVIVVAVAVAVRVAVEAVADRRLGGHL